MDLRKFKKVASDDKSTTLEHPAGHMIVVAHKNLHPTTREQLAALPMFKGGKVDPTKDHEMQGDKIPDKAETAAVAQAKPEKMAAGGMTQDQPQDPSMFSDLVDKAQAVGKGIIDKADANLKENYARNVAASKGDLAAQTEVAQNSLGASMGSLEAVPGAGDVEAIGPAAEKEAAEANLAMRQEQAAKNRALWRQEQNALDAKAAGARKLGGKFADGGEVTDNAAPLQIDQMPPDQVPLQIDQMPDDAPAQAAQSPQQAPQEATTPPGMPPQAAAPQEPQVAPDAAPQQSPMAQGADTTKAAFDAGLSSTMAGNQQEAAVAQKLGDAQAATLGRQVGIQAQQQTEYQNHYKALEMERQALQNDINNQHIDPNHFINTMDGASKIATAIGLIASGMGSAMAHQSNLAADFLHKQIDNDIAAQKANLGKTENLLSANMRQFGNLRDATDMTRIMQTDILANKLKMEAAKATGPAAQANLLKASGDLLMKNAGTMGQLAMRQSLLSGAGAAGKDPSMLIPMMVPEVHQKAAFEEVKRAQDTRRMADTIMNSFDTAAKENTVMRTGAGMLRTPGSVLALHQSMQPTFGDLEGTVRQSAMDNTFHNITPAPGDSEHKLAQKRQALEEYLVSKKSAPIAKGFGLDLDRFESTQPHQNAPVFKTMGGVKYQKTQGGWIKAQ